MMTSREVSHALWDPAQNLWVGDGWKMTENERKRALDAPRRQRMTNIMVTMPLVSFVVAFLGVWISIEAGYSSLIVFTALVILALWIAALCYVHDPVGTRTVIMVLLLISVIGWFALPFMRHLEYRDHR